MCLGVRREEVWALKWSDFDFVTGTVTIARTIIESRVYERTKTEASAAELPLDDDLVQLLLDWRGKSEFNRDTDWVWGISLQRRQNAAALPVDAEGNHRPSLGGRWTGQDRVALLSPHLPASRMSCASSIRGWSSG